MHVYKLLCTRKVSSPDSCIHIETLLVHKVYIRALCVRWYLVHAKISYVCSSPVRGPYTL